MGEQAAAGAEFDQFDALGRAESAPHLVELAGQKAAEDGVDVARRVEIAGLAELLRVSRIVAKLGIVEADFHVAREGDGAAVTDFPFDLFAEEIHNSFRRRSTRSCGVRTNISTK